jgi:hypothetical protein
MNQYQILGQQVAEALQRENNAADMELLADALVTTGDAEILGAFDFSSLINAAAEGANKGVAYKQDQDAQNKAKADAAVAAAKAIAADVNWASAEQQLDLQQHSPRPDANALAAAQSLQNAAMQASMAAGAGLSPDAQAKRVGAAQDAMTKASQASLAAPGDASKAALMRAWQKVVAGAGAGMAPAALEAAKKGHEGKGGTSWWTPTHIAYVAGGTVAVTGLVLLLRKFLHKGGHR